MLAKEKENYFCHGVKNRFTYYITKTVKQQQHNNLKAKNAQEAHLPPPYSCNIQPCPRLYQLHSVYLVIYVQ